MTDDDDLLGDDDDEEFTERMRQRAEVDQNTAYLSDTYISMWANMYRRLIDEEGLPPPVAERFMVVYIASNGTGSTTFNLE